MAIGLGKFIGGIKFGVSMDTKKLNRDTKKARMMLNGFVGQSVRMLGVYGGAAGVIAVVGKAAGSYENLNRSMNRSLAIMGNVSTSMRRDMTSAAIEVSRVTNASATEAADAYFYLASAGLDAKQSLGALPKVAKFAQAGNFDLALATDLLTDAQSALGLTVKDTTKNIENMTRVSDVLIKANTLANATAQQFSEALTNKAGAALRLVGKDVEEGVAVLAAFADQGIKGAEAGTGFGIVLRDLQTKAIKFSNDFKKAGVSVFDSSGEMRNMADIMYDLERNMIGLSDQAKKTFLLDLGFSDKSVSFVQALVGVSDKIREYEKALRGAGGATDAISGRQLTTLEKATEKLGAAFTKLSERMAPAVDNMARMLESVAGILDKMSQFGQPDIPVNGKKSGLFGTDSYFPRFDKMFAALAKGGEDFVNAIDEFARGLSLTDSRGKNTTFREALETQGASMIEDIGPRGFAAPAGASSKPGYSPQTLAKANAEAMAKGFVAELPNAIDKALKFTGFRKDDIPTLSNRATKKLGKFLGDIGPDAIKSIQATAGSAFLGLFNLRNKLAAMGIAPTAGNAVSQNAFRSERTERLSALQEGTAEAFSASRRGSRATTEKSIEKNTGRAVDVLVQVKNGIDNMAKMMPKERGLA